MIEIHPFAPFVPAYSKTLILGSFPGKESTQIKREDDWFYCAKRNQFWKILQIVFNRDLTTTTDKKKLFEENQIAITDILLSCERQNNLNSDENLINKTYNQKAISSILATKPIERILFTSKGVYKEFVKHFDIPKDIVLIVLPSPSPIFRRLKIDEKAAIYQQYLIP